MNRNRTFKQIMLAMLIVFSVTACGGQFFGGTATPIPTNTLEATKTPIPTNTATATATPKPTSTPLPTKTPVPPTPTPAPIGVSVISDSLEITVLDVTTHSHIVPGGLYYYYSKPGKTFVDVSVRVRNLNPGKPVRVQWRYVYILEGNGDSWYPLYGDIKQVDSGKQFNPNNISISTEVRGSDFVAFDNDTYLRLIYYVTNDPNQTILFRIEDSQQIEFHTK